MDMGAHSGAEIRVHVRNTYAILFWGRIPRDQDTKIKSKPVKEYSLRKYWILGAENKL
jgi:hypothetical protein